MMQLIPGSGGPCIVMKIVIWKHTSAYIQNTKNISNYDHYDNKCLPNLVYIQMSHHKIVEKVLTLHISLIVQHKYFTSIITTLKVILNVTFTCSLLFHSLSLLMRMYIFLVNDPVNVIIFGDTIRSLRR
jgi:hypothetical protein